MERRAIKYKAYTQKVKGKRITLNNRHTGITRVLRLIATTV